MKLYSNILTEHDVYRAFTEARQLDGADIYPDDISTFQPRTPYRHGVKFYATSLHGRQITGHRPIGSYPLDGEARAASWDAYGYVIARLYRIDPDARIGHYKGIADFISTCEAASRREPKDFLNLVRTGVRSTTVALSEVAAEPGQPLSAEYWLDKHGK